MLVHIELQQDSFFLFRLNLLEHEIVGESSDRALTEIVWHAMERRQELQRPASDAHPLNQLLFFQDGP